MQPVASKGKAGKLTEDDLMLAESEESNFCYDQFIKNWNKELTKEKHPSLYRAIRRTWIGQFMIAAVFKFCWSVLVLFSSFYLVRSLVSFVQRANRGEDAPDYEGWTLACAFFVACFLFSVFLQQMTSKATRLGIRIRAAMSTAIYRKALRAENIAPDAGDVVSLVATDCTRLLEAAVDIHYLWSAPLEALAIVVLLIILTGYSALIGLGLTLFVLGMQLIIGRAVTRLRSKSIYVTDSRIHIMQEILLAIKLVKFYGWERSFAEAIARIRKQELKMLGQNGWYKTVNLMLVFWIPPLMALGIFTLYTIVEGGTLTSAVAFTTLSLFNTLRFPLVVLPKSIRSFAEAITATKRIQKFLLRPELQPVPVADQPGEILIEKADFGYGEGEPIISGVSMQMNGKLMALVGPVGSGKSTLLSAILGEARCKEGVIKVGGRVGYLLQQPFIQMGTVRDNILFGMPYEAEKYKRVVFACALERDFQILEHGDLTQIGERGINLSGGQQQRIALARAVYSDADILLLDSPLSAVDQNTSNHIFQYCLQDYLRGKTVVLVTHQLQILHNCDLVGIMEKGKLVYFGGYDSEVMAKHFTVWRDYEETAEKKDAKKTASDLAHDVAEDFTVPENMAVSEGAAIKEYIKQGGRTTFVFSMIIFAVTQVARIISDWFISAWTDDRFVQPQWFYNVVYAAMVALFGILLIIRGVVFYKFVLRAATKMHNKLFERVLKAPIVFFTQTPVGNLLNSFSKDQDAIDETLPDIVHITIIYLMILLTTMILVCVVLPYYTIVAAALLGSLIALQWYFIKCSRKLKTIAASTNSPIFAHLSETIQGISIVRAYRAQERMILQTQQRVDRNHKALFNLEHLQMWLAFRLDVIGSLLVVATALFCVGLRFDIAGSATGLAISNSIQKLVFFTLFVRGTSDALSHVTSVQRIVNYTKTIKPERDEAEMEVPPQWPSEGNIQYNEVVMKYRDDQEPVLKGVTIEIRPQEKIGVVGRTGSGKSSLLMALFRLVQLSSGTVIIDGIDISKLGLEAFRKRLSIIPQEPVLFKGTLRTNLDPFGEYSDDLLWRSLELSHLKDTVNKFEGKLDTPIDAGGSNFSLGQKQLFCLARAILKDAKILVLDEATSAMDLETDALIQNTIRNVFGDRTVITIAHRLDTIIDSDRILVMDQGSVVEFGSKYDLLKKKGYFASLIADAGLLIDEPEDFKEAEKRVKKHKEKRHKKHKKDKKKEDDLRNSSKRELIRSLSKEVRKIRESFSESERSSILQQALARSQSQEQQRNSQDVERIENNVA